MIVLGIETSCDETSVAIVKKKNRFLLGDVLSENTLSQVKKHKKFGGVVPELASREHSNTLDYLVKKTLKESGLSLCEIDAFAATLGPGLLGGLIVGSNYAKTLALTTKKPFVAVNHLQGHILVTRMKRIIKFPFLCLLVSGGHTQMLLVRKYNDFKLIGETLDDAIGEAFDKVAKLMGYSYPGGPIIEKLALKAKKKVNFNLPEPLINSKNFNFSFSGIKTATRKIIDSSFDKKLKCELAKNFQDCVTNCLITKCSKAIDLYKKKKKINSFVLAGGVASNKFIREKFINLCAKKSVQFIVPEQDLCVDNATMIAWAAIERLQINKKGDILDFEPKPRWALEKL
jgi:N6-L-threonylcarbamoyladenine synthase